MQNRTSLRRLRSEWRVCVRLGEMGRGYGLHEPEEKTKSGPPQKDGPYTRKNNPRKGVGPEGLS